jgi:hypothetical protein
MSLTTQDKADLRVMMHDVVHEVIAQEVTPRFTKLEDQNSKIIMKMDANHTVVMRHLLETKRQVGDMQKDLTTFKEGIAAAAR